ncbi:uncharacterized protein ARMOST_10150 [Armillaria ostoyae]|uniref:DUF6533 domain-containing protein n=1 Tax=Armillaria ostoyae TaxID=47428 RepID=A0A284RDK7_ARMOS|nr:uncharacterized protein ARMOST_10150 [Armillaria ostoyae]
MSLATSSNSFSSYSVIASVTVLVYDLLLLLSTEINYVWLPRPVHRLLLLFALNRYLPLIDAAIAISWLLYKPSAAQCRQLSFIRGPLAALGIFISQVILMIRTYAIWDRHRVVFWCFIGIGIFSFVPGVVGLGIKLKTSQCGLLVIRDSRELIIISFAVVGPFDNPGCLSHSPKVANLLYIPVLVSETIIASLTLVKGVQHLRRSSHPFLTELYISGMLFYACLLLITLVNILVPMWAPGVALFLGPFQVNLHSILSNRIMLLILKQRRTYRRYPTEELSTGDIELSDITSDGPGSRTDVKNATGITSGSDGRIQSTAEITYA